LTKVLHIGFSNPALGKAFRDTVDYRFIDWTDWTAIPNNIENLHKYITKTSDDFSPDIIFMQIQSPGVITPEFIKTLPGLIINWTWDFRGNTPEWVMDLAPYCISAFTNENDVYRVLMTGNKSVFLQSGFDHEIYKSDDDSDTVSESPEIVFMANNYPDDEKFPLSDYRIDLVNTLKDIYGTRFGVYGFGWPGQNPLQSFMHRERKEAACYRSAKLAINLSHFVAKRYTSDRMLRILGSGTMCLSHWYPEIEKDFTDGTHLRVWNSTDDLIKLIDQYLADDSGREAIAASGCTHAHASYTWHNMVSQILKLLYI